MNRERLWLRLVFVLVAILVFDWGYMQVRTVAAVQGAGDLYIKDTPFDTGIEPNPDTGPMWVTEDIWVRTTPDPNYQPYPFAEASPPWIPLPHENPEYRDPQYSLPNYVYVRIRNRGSSASNGTEELHLYWAKASTGLSWPTQWVDYLPNGVGTTELYGAEVTKPRKNAATATQSERDAYVKAILDIGTMQFPDGVSYWNKQDQVHELGPANRHRTTNISSLAFLPWHREFINRYELLLQEANPTVKLLYWNWTTNPQPLGGGFNYFTSTFMGVSGRPNGASIGAPFMPALAPIFLPPGQPSDIVRRLGNTPPAISDNTVLGNNNTTYQDFTNNNEISAHDGSHGYISGNMGIIQRAAEDPFFFLLHANADRLWARWQRNQANLWRLDPNYAYGCDPAVSPTPLNCNPSHSNVTTLMGPWDGTGVGIQPWRVGDRYNIQKSPKHASVVLPPIYDTAPLVIPILQPGQAVIIQIPWYPPNPADFASFGGDQRHFCLLARIETSTTSPFGMTFPEGSDVFTNTRNNNNIGWKNITVVDFSGVLRLTSILIRNVFKAPVLTGLRFANTEEIGASFFDFGRISVDLGPELYERWRAEGQVGQGVDNIGETTIGIFSPEAFIQNIPLEPGEVFSVDVHFELSEDYQLPRGVLPKWDLIQTGAPEDPEAIIGGQRFELDFSKLLLIRAGSEWRYLDNGSSPDKNWLMLDFDDSEWRLGQSELGFGDDPVTTIDGGPPNDRHITTYFRNTFEVTNPGFFQSLYLRLKRNDGAVVYLNGTEIYRVNLPEDELMPGTLATHDVGGLERDVFFPIEIDLGLLQEGINVIAVEIHLASPDSEDLSFDLELYANPADTRFLPDVAFASPINGTLFKTDQVIPIETEALDSDGQIMSVSFFADEELLGSDDNSPYIFQWKGAPLGPHRLRAVASDNDGLEFVVDTTVIVLENVPPSVELTQPGDGTTFQVGEVILVSAQPSDDDGEISRVEFYLRKMELFTDPAVLVGTVEAAPYEISLRDVAPGHYMLTAIAIDDGGAASQSIPVMLMIQ